MLELLDNRYGQRSTLVTSQMPVDNWHELIGDPTLADAILDRLVPNAYWINLKSESIRKRTKKLTAQGCLRLTMQTLRRYAPTECPDGVESAAYGRSRIVTDAATIQTPCNRGENAGHELAK